MKRGGIALWLLAATGIVHQVKGQAPAKDLLRALQGGIHVSLRQYQGDSLVHQWTFNGNTLTNAQGRWQLQWQQSAIPGNPAGQEITLTCKLLEGAAPSTAVAVDFGFGHWQPENYVMVPAIVYNGNRYRAIGNGYNPDYPKDMYYNPAVPVTISNNPRLSVSATGPSGLELSTTNTSVPAMSFYAPAAKKGWMVLTEQATRYGNSGLSIRENDGRDSCTFTITAPAMRKMAAGFGDFHPSGDQAPDWAAGNDITIRFRVYTFSASGIPDLLTQFMTLRKSLTGPNHPRNLVPMSKLAALGTDICRNNFVETKAGSYYLPENSRNFQLGWVSGMINTYPMLALNDEEERSRVVRELDFITSRMQGKSGFFYGFISEEGKLGTEKGHPDFPALQAMVRKNGDVLFWLMKHLLLLKAQGHGQTIHPEWEAAAQKLAAAFVQNWQRNGEFGQYIVPETGEISVFNSSAGAIVPAGLALAADYFHRPEWLHTAEAAAAFYYQRDVVTRGFTSGACGDISQDADSETAFGFLESLMALYQYTQQPVWLERAKVQAALCATWTMAYDPVFPPGSDIGKLQCHMAGAVWASSQNKHAAPGACTTSADHLFKLYRATGDERYAALIRDIQHAHTEAVNMPGHITTNYLIGSSMERIQLSDAEGKGSIGNFIHTRNSWTETNGILMAMELPGIYVRPGEGKLFVFDHINATRVSEDKGAVTLRLSNTTAYDAAVSVMAESAGAAKKPLGYTAFQHWPKVAVAAGATVNIKVAKNGEVTVL
ncbi:hypothetical protein [Chitinophaga eiseniae]|uniref:Uncharacterized protein n=1 Tax=Chitinophaga eiseniae TaxID=634771 RepID=A0A847SR02_9BACT|nr:hypothetical protein [Chitinophaga eiseniae]NLR80368.1 hypothetical protein [Chitinophaga eiseniae]